MQLFICEFQKNGNQILIQDERIIHQLKNVLRAGPEYVFQLQKVLKFGNNEDFVRYDVQIDKFEKNVLVGTVISEHNFNLNKYKGTGIIVSMLNKFEKIELIIQKLCEIGIDKIYLWPSERSIIREISDSKIDRLNKIAIEAVEQSKGFFVPDIIYTKKLPDVTNCFVFDMIEESDNISSNSKFVQDIAKNNTDIVYGLIGPEGGFSINDYKLFENKIIQKISLGKTVLRAETATIIGGWMTKNMLL